MFIQKSKITSILFMLPILLFLLSGCFLIPEDKKLIQPSMMEHPKITYNTVIVKRGTLEKNLALTGYFTPTKKVNVYFTMTEGRVSQINSFIGDTVKEGDIMLSLEAADLEYNVRIQKLYFQKAQLIYNRIKKAYEAGTIGTDDFETAKIDLEIAKNQLEDSIDLLDNSNLYAPVSGQIIYVNSAVGLGAYVSTYDSLYTVADLAALELQYSTTEENKGFVYLQFEPGMLVEVDYENRIYEGEVTGMTAASIAVGVVEKTLHFDVKGLPGTVELGQNAGIKLVLEKAENVLIIPKRAIYTYGNRIYVQILEDGIKKERDVKTGLESDTRIEIIEGLNEGDLVIVN